MYKSLCEPVFISLGCKPGSRIARSYGNSVFHVFRNSQAIFQMVVPFTFFFLFVCFFIFHLHSYQHCMRVPISLSSSTFVIVCFVLLVVVPCVVFAFP